MIEDAIRIYTRKKPLVIGHELLANLIKPHECRPVVIKIHRDLLLLPKNSERDLKVMHEDFADRLRQLLKFYTPIVIGYGGNDGSLMGFFEEIEQINGGMFWCYREVDGKPSEKIQNVVSKHHGFFVTISGFDELMIQLGNRLYVPSQDREIVKNAEHLAKRYRGQIKDISEMKEIDHETKYAIANIFERTRNKD